MTPVLHLPPPLVFASCGALMGWAAPALWPPHSWASLFGVALLGLLAIGLSLAALAGFVRVGTTLDPRRPEKSSALICGGIYRYSRNPMYLALLLLLLGWGLWLGGQWWGPVLFWLWMDKLQIPHEERALTARFQENYTQYCRQVRRWC